MKKSSRKRLLVSSVAMLLVAMIALGTATFAWFTTNTTATADGIVVRTAKLSSLEISKVSTDSGWMSQINYARNAYMYPVSTADGRNFFKTTANAKNNYGKDAKAEITKVGTITSVDDYLGDSPATEKQYLFKDRLRIRNSGEGKIEDVKIILNNIVSDYVKIAVVPADSGATNYAVPKDVDEATFNPLEGNVYAIDNEVYNGYTSVAGETQEIIPSTGIGAPTTANKKLEIKLPDLNGVKVDDNGNTEYDVQDYIILIWFEGQDEDCYTDHAGTPFGALGNLTRDDVTGKFTSDFSIEVTGNPVKKTENP